MGESLLDLLQKVTVLDLVWALVLITVIIGIVLSQKKRVSKVFNRWRKTKNEEEDFVEMVYNLKDSVESLKKTMETYKGNREHDRNDSIRIREEIYEAISAQAEGIQELKRMTLEIQEKNSKTTRAEMKEKIERIYRECHPVMACTDMQYETLKELIEEYEEHGGRNSFVHSIVEPEMLTWKKINIITNE